MRVTLTPQELEALRLLGYGLPHRAVAGRLGVAVRTLDRRVVSALRKLNADNVIQAILKASDLGYIELRREGLPRRRLTPREQQALREVARRGTIRDAAFGLDLSYHTIAHRISAARTALGVPPRFPLVGLAVRAAIFGQLPSEGGA